MYARAQLPCLLTAQAPSPQPPQEAMAHLMSQGPRASGPRKRHASERRYMRPASSSRGNHVSVRQAEQCHCCRQASQAPPAHNMQQVAWSCPSACQASTHAPQMLASAVRQQQHACTGTAAVVAHGAAACNSVHPPGQASCMSRWDKNVTKRSEPM